MTLKYATPLPLYTFFVLMVVARTLAKAYHFLAEYQSEARTFRMRFVLRAMQNRFHTICKHR